MPAPSEFDLQRAFVIWLDGSKDKVTGVWRIPPMLAPGVVYWHTPNGGSRDAFEGKRFRESGVKAGIPDLLFLRQGCLYGMEWKAPGGRLSPAQLAMHPRLVGAGMADLITVDNLPAAKEWAFRFMLTVNKT